MCKDNDYIYEAITALEEISRFTIEFYSNRAEYDGIIDIEGERFYMFTKKDARLIHANLIINDILNHPNYKKDKNYLVVADFIANESKEVFKNHNINFLDTSGNAYIYSKYLKIYIEGRKKSKIENNNVSNKIFQEAGLKLLYVLLTNKASINYSFRELAACAGIALGSVSNIMKELQHANYMLKTTTERKFNNKELLLEQWVTAYNEVIKPKLFRKSYQINNVNDLFDNCHDLSFRISGELAATKIYDYLVPKKIEIYYSEELLDIVQYFKLTPDVNGNLKIYNKFWLDNNDIVNQRLASNLIIYADLMGTTNDINRQIAQIILRKGL